MDATRRHNTRSITTKYIMKDGHANSIMPARKQSGEAPILVVECLAIR